MLVNYIGLLYTNCCTLYTRYTIYRLLEHNTQKNTDMKRHAP